MLLDFTLAEVQKIIDGQPEFIHIWKVIMATKCNDLFLATISCEICNSMGVIEMRKTCKGWVSFGIRDMVYPTDYNTTLCFQKEDLKRKLDIKHESLQQLILERRSEYRRIMNEQRLIEYEELRKENEELIKRRKKEERLRIESCEKEKRVWRYCSNNPQIKANLEIIKAIGTGNTRFRRNLAIYRLYRYCNLSPWEIAFLTSYKEARIRYVIGSVFRVLCLNDKSCVFKKLLSNV